MRSLAAVLLGALLSLGSAGAQAQVYKEIKGCAGSMKVLITCVVIERGVEKVLDVGLSDLVAYILGTKSGVEPAPTPPSPAEVETVKANLIPWAEFKAFLLSALGQQPADDPAQMRAKIADACAAKYSPVCAQFGIYQNNRFPNCTGLTKEACTGGLFGCAWTGTTCRPAGGTKELLKEMQKQ